jgi:hypothetical protein
MNNLKKYISAQIDEIKNSKTLKWFGLSLIIAHFASFIFFFDSGRAWTLESYPICWSFYQNCEWGRSFILQSSSLYIHLYLFSILAGLLFFLSGRWKGFYFALLAATLLKFVYTLHDYRTMGNYHYMLYLALFVYLMIPRKIFALKWFLVLCYVSSGLLRFEADWLTGAVLPPLPGFSQKMIEISAAYVVILECIFAFLLLAKKPLWFWLGMAQFLVFHIFSYQIVGWFFPAIMLGLLSIFLLERFFETELSHPSIAELTTNFRNYNFAFTFLVIFMFVQIIPRWIYPFSAIDGAGRVLFLNMFDARTECDGRVLIHQKNGDVIERVEQSIETSIRAERIKCDPVVFLAKAQDLCRKLENESTFIDLDVSLVTRRVTEARWFKTLDHRNVCTDPPRVNWLGEVKNEI